VKTAPEDEYCSKGKREASFAWQSIVCTRRPPCTFARLKSSPSNEDPMARARFAMKPSRSCPYAVKPFCENPPRCHGLLPRRACAYSPGHRGAMALVPPPPPACGVSGLRHGPCRAPPPSLTAAASVPHRPRHRVRRTLRPPRRKGLGFPPPTSTPQAGRGACEGLGFPR
jgi:hypothetical protein